jgi:hypothetical protein
MGYAEANPVFTTSGVRNLRTDGWKSYQVAPKELGIVHHRAILRDPKDSMKLLPWTHRLIANAKAVISGPHRGVSAKHLQRYLTEVCYRFTVLGSVNRSTVCLMHVHQLTLPPETNSWAEKLLSRVNRPNFKRPSSAPLHFSLR